MPQLLLGAGNPYAISIEATTMAWLGTGPFQFLSQMSTDKRILFLGVAYSAYEMFIVPRFAPVRPGSGVSPK